MNQIFNTLQHTIEYSCRPLPRLAHCGAPLWRTSFSLKTKLCRRRLWAKHSRGLPYAHWVNQAVYPHRIQPQRHTSRIVNAPVAAARGLYNVCSLDLKVERLMFKWMHVTVCIIVERPCMDHGLLGVSSSSPPNLAEESVRLKKCSWMLFAHRLHMLPFIVQALGGPLQAFRTLSRASIRKNHKQQHFDKSSIYIYCILTPAFRVFVPSSSSIKGTSSCFARCKMVSLCMLPLWHSVRLVRHTQWPCPSLSSQTAFPVKHLLCAATAVRWSNVSNILVRGWALSQWLSHAKFNHFQDLERVGKIC